MQDRPSERLVFPLMVGCAMLLIAQISGAAIYRYEDANGHTYLTDRPMKGNYSLKSVFYTSRTSKYASAVYRRNRNRYSPMIDAAAKRLRLRPELLHAVVRAESSYDPTAKSKAGAVGLMQLMPGTADRYGVRDRLDPAQNINGGASYLRDLLKEFKDDLKLALAAYNAGENAVKKYGNQIPPYPETQHYVRKVLGFLNPSP
ncbi:Endo-type membrane-bound lytic murein transglycosylase A (EC 4.2.2.n2) [hydrothermal vent metagenome]|uniref:Endo-type membrane-bound lytic murein transglycosylase A n=1 Tax=hydrothermal vent metagenome TaxID=652676 RepID=A0A3B1BAE6_9ZZZZ